MRNAVHADSSDVRHVPGKLSRCPPFPHLHLHLHRHFCYYVFIPPLRLLSSLLSFVSDIASYQSAPFRYAACSPVSIMRHPLRSKDTAAKGPPKQRMVVETDRASLVAKGCLEVGSSRGTEGTEISTDQLTEVGSSFCNGTTVHGSSKVAQHRT